MVDLRLRKPLAAFVKFKYKSFFAFGNINTFAIAKQKSQHMTSYIIIYSIEN